MNKKQFFTVFLFYMSYLFFGAVVYYFIEPALEMETFEQKTNMRREIVQLLLTHLSPDDLDRQEEIMDKLSHFCGVPFTMPKPEEKTVHFWTFYHSLFFTMTIVTTVGYGNMYPRTTFGRIFLIFYAVLGMPMNAIIFGRLGQIFGKFFLGMYDRFVENKFSSRKRYIEWRLNIFAQFFIVLAPGMILFIFLPALVFSYFERWDYTISVYYAFVTLTTIGFGDFAATFSHTGDNYVYKIYETFVFIWFILGLAYVIMITESLIRMYQRTKVSRLGFKFQISAKRQRAILYYGMKSDLKSIGRFIACNPSEENSENTIDHLKRSKSCPNLNCIKVAKDGEETE